MTDLLKRAVRHLPAVLGVLLLFGAIYVVQKEFRSLKIADIRAALGAIPASALIAGFAWTLLAYAILTLYDRLGTIYAGRAVSYGKVSFASFCAYSLAHNLGFAAVSGAAVRYRLYAQWGLTPLQIGKVVAFCSLTFGLGGMVLGGAILAWEPQAVPFLGKLLPQAAMYSIAGVLWAIVIGYVTLSKLVGHIRLFGHEVELPGARMAVLQVLLATVDVAVTAAIFYTLLPPGTGLSYV
ncbi:MAG TPA: YbhN family protein, partial [Acetobacteraceae bacterium]